MKKEKGVALFCALLLCLLAACGDGEYNGPKKGASQGNTPAETSSTVSTPASLPEENDDLGLWEQAKIMDINGETVTVLTEDTSLLAFAVPQDLSFDQDALGTELKPGMTVHIGYDGIVQETYPGQITVACMEVNSYDDGLVSLYYELLAALIDDEYGNWEELQYLGFDFSGVESLTPEESQAIGWLFASSRGKEPLFGTIEDFADQGYIRKDGDSLIGWNDSAPGIAITVATGDSTEASLKLEVEAWYGNLGAGWYEATAEKKNGQWTLGQLVQTAVS